MTPEMWQWAQTGGSVGTLLLVVVLLMTGKLVTGREHDATVTRCNRYEALVFENVALAKRLTEIIEKYEEAATARR